MSVNVFESEGNIASHTLKYSFVGFFSSHGYVHKSSIRANIAVAKQFNSSGIAVSHTLDVILKVLQKYFSSGAIANHTLNLGLGYRVFKSYGAIVTHNLGVNIGRRVFSAYGTIASHTVNTSIEAIPAAASAIIRAYRFSSFDMVSPCSYATKDYDSAVFPSIITPGSRYHTLWYFIRKVTNQAIVLADGRRIYRGYSRFNEPAESGSYPPPKLSFSNIAGKDLKEFSVPILSIEPMVSVGPPEKLIEASVKTHPMVYFECFKPRIQWLDPEAGIRISGSLVCVNTSPIEIAELPLTYLLYWKPSDIYAEVVLTPKRELEPGDYGFTLQIDPSTYVENIGSPLKQASTVGDPQVKAILPATFDFEEDYVYITTGIHYPGGTEPYKLYVFIPSKVNVGGIASSGVAYGPVNVGSGETEEFTYTITGWYYLPDSELYAYPTSVIRTDVPRNIGYGELKTVNYSLIAGPPNVAGPAKLEAFSTTSLCESTLDVGLGVQLLSRSVEWENSKAIISLTISNKFKFPVRNLKITITVMDGTQVLKQDVKKIPWIPAETTFTLKVEEPVPKVAPRAVGVSSPFFEFTEVG